MPARIWGLINSLGSVQFNEIPGFNFTLYRQQQENIYSRTNGGLSRIRGPAGSGKSLVIAHRAVKLASEGRQVLVICFNITLLNLLHYMALRATRKMDGVEMDHLRNISFCYFHEWAKNIAM